jgi:hypothetical protein
VLSVCILQWQNQWISGEIRMTTYVKKDIQRAFDYLKIASDDLQNTAFKWENKEKNADILWDARGKIVEAIEMLSLANLGR